LDTKFDKFNLPDDDDDETSEEEEGTSNRSNAALTHQIKKNKRGGNWKENLSVFRIRLGYVGRVEEGNRADLDSHTDCCVFGKEVLEFNDFDREVTVTGWDPEVETKPLQIVSAALGHTIPETGKTVLMISHQSICSPTLNHNFLSTIQMRLHDVVVNETPTYQCLKPAKLEHSISVRGENVDQVLVIPLDLHGGVSCFPTFKPSQEEFETC
jgi:hypothetical protein